MRVIKTLREQILNHPDWIPHRNRLQQSFCEEALRLSLCRHPHIVQIENAFSEVIFPCIAMDYIEGEDLGRRRTQNILASISSDNTIKLWDVTTDNKISNKFTTLTGYENDIVYIVFSRYEEFLLSAGLDGNIKIWRSQLVVQ